MAKLDPSQIDIKEAKLKEVARQLKSELYGLDETIDKVINSIKAWYTFPEIIQRPVIVCLWGLTGVGKTQLVRRLVQLLEFQNKFVEIQMDGITSSSSNHDRTIGGILAESSIEEGEAGILLLDEFQRYKTISKENGGDVKVERFQDVWMLLSDGKFSSNSTLFGELEMMIAQQKYSESYPDDDDDDDEDGEPTTSKKKERAPRKYHIWPYEARSLKKRLKLRESVLEIMEWGPGKVAEKIQECKESRAGDQIDYSKLLVFISGNLDEAYSMSTAVDDCDTDADIYYELSKRVTVNDIKAALGTRFKPEQIARLGNNHVIYTSLSRSTYQKIIHATCDKYLTDMQKATDINFSLTKNAEDVIYDNAVYPSQGTRPVFSSVHKILSDGLVELSFWGIKNSIDSINIDIDADKAVLVGAGSTKLLNRGAKIFTVPVDLDISSQRKNATKDFNTMVAVHEAGHALVFALLKGTAPKEVKINPVSFKGGYTLPSIKDNIRNAETIKDDITVLFAGRTAEIMVFGKDKASAGAASDFDKATMQASRYVRELGMDQFNYVVSSTNALFDDCKLHYLTNVIETDPSIVSILNVSYEKSKALLEENKTYFLRLIERLMDGTALQQEEFIELFPELKLVADEDTGGYFDAWKNFSNS